MSVKGPSLILVGVSLLLSCCCCCNFPSLADRSGDKLFKTFVLDPIPRSVSILHSHDEVLLFDPSIWLHFTIAPEDFELIFASEEWVVSDSSFDGIDNAEVEDWWNPESLGDYTWYYVYSEDHKWWKNMWVNTEKDEVYFRVDFF